MADDKTNKKDPDLSLDLPEPPKFDLGALPEPPKLDEIKPKKQGLFGKLFTKKAKPESNIAKDYDKFVSDSKKEQVLKDIPLPQKDNFFDTANLLQRKEDKPAEPAAMPVKKEFPDFDIPEPPKMDMPKDIPREMPKTEPSLPKQPVIPEPPSFDIPAETKFEDARKKGLFSKLFKKEEKAPVTPALPAMPKDMPEISEPPATEPAAPQLFMPELPKEEPNGTDWAKEKEEIDATAVELKEKGVIESDLKEKELPAPVVAEEKPAEPTPVSEVNGVGETTEKKLKKIKIRSAEDLAKLDHEHLAKKAKIPKHMAKKIVAHAKKIVQKKHKNIKQIRKDNLVPEKKTISSLIGELEKEKTELRKLKRETDKKDDISVKGHEQIIGLLDKLEKKKVELLNYESRLSEKEKELSTHGETYRRDMEYIENLKRRLDHDVRERTQYLIDMEKEFFTKGQDIAKRQSALEIKEEQLVQVDKTLREKETQLKKKANDMEDREINIKEKEAKVNKLMKELENQETILNSRSAELDRKEADLGKKQELLEKHEEEMNKHLDEKKKSLDKKGMSLEKLEKQVSTKERKVEIEDKALDYAESELESQKKKLEKAEFKEYLRERVSDKKTEPAISVDDIELTRSIKVPDLQERPETVYDLIEKCKRLTAESRITEAKLVYNKIRERFYFLRFSSPEEKENLHNIIRALYDDISLAGLGQRKIA